ncbi:MAG: low temperature requirement protein A [Acidobacteriota bacterium]|nr:low temperature requirement protein A [Acidobacteriota bacterium]
MNTPMTPGEIERQPARLTARPRLRTIERTNEERHASWLELFFDLVFVLAVAQVAYTLSHDLTTGGALRYFALFAPVWWAWVGYTFYADRFESEEYVYRLLMFAGMLAVVALAVNVRGAFTIGGGFAFALSYVAVRAVLIVLYARAAYHVPLARELCVRYIIGFGIGAALWFVSAFVDAPARYWLWAGGLAVELLTPALSNRIVNRTPFDTSHIPERFGLFTIIVLGEAVVATANGALEVEWRASSMLTAGAGFAVAAALWWIHFEFVEDYALRSARMTSRYVYLYGHFFTVAGVVVTGIGVEHAITEAGNTAASLATRIALCGGAALFLVAITAVRLATGICLLVRTRLIAIGIVCALLAAGAFVPPLALTGLLLAVLIGEVWLESTYDESSRSGEGVKEPPQKCAHLNETRPVTPNSDGCEECIKGKQKWVHLRLCLICGHVGCCDSSKNKHATGHFDATGHPVMKSLEAGESWAWCYVDGIFVAGEQLAGESLKSEA